MRKILTLILITIVTAALVYVLARFVRMDSFSFAWALNFLLMMGALSFTETLKSDLSSSYYNAKQWERGGKVYEQLGINFYRKLLVIIGWEKLNKKNNPVAKGTQTLINLHHQTKKAELGHLIILFIVTGFNVFVALKFGFVKSLSLLILNVLFNLYPIFLQRYNRPRIARAISLSKRR
ncbi:hypothetical protein IM792_06740 [Mucilaginibacter sp. JRF]|uniref:glycosyl-4,4'-diaponeurosporenoate acyltransferase CrtO family protein n=1 Tax=Mucilaginibacter sp. JRF TaxID=2780088 RepID=UPI0018830926|nr:hypothetical protein [Mucilaginibacter sp. JRF]MBE9584138.1 hypothetical protein [Mucilaginibacter sp. JRF]